MLAGDAPRRAEPLFTGQPNESSSEPAMGSGRSPADTFVSIGYSALKPKESTKNPTGIFYALLVNAVRGTGNARAK